MKKEQTRELLPDLLKAWGIILVVWGHAVQYCHGSAYDFQNDLIYQLIYGFHMPLFMMVSGYLLVGSLERHRAGEVLIIKCQSLLLPSLFWGILMACMSIAQMLASGQIPAVGECIWLVVYKIACNFWFLKAVFISCLVVIIVEKCLSGSSFAYCLICAAGILAPDFFNLSTIGLVLPFFVIGYRHGAKIWDIKFTIPRCLLVTVSYLLLLMGNVWMERTLQVDWLTGRSINGLANFVLGMTGSLSVIGWAAHLRNRLPKRVLDMAKNLGRSTMMIYIASTVEFTAISMLLGRFETIASETFLGAMLYDIVVLLPLSIMLIAICYLIEKIVDKSAILSMLMFGKRKTR